MTIASQQPLTNRPLVQQLDQQFAVLHQLQPRAGHTLCLTLSDAQASQLAALCPALAGFGESLPMTAFYQQPSLFAVPQAISSFAQCRTEAGHYLRAPYPDQHTLYRRLHPVLGREFTLKRLSAEYMPHFCRWQRQPRVAKFWEMAWPDAELQDYVFKLRDSQSHQPLIGFLDGRAVAYFELYWASQDRIAPFCEATPYDRGMHLLIGEDDTLGIAYTQAWLNTLSHFMFLSDPRCQRLVGEPRADNAAMLKYLAHTRWQHHGEFDFPHKRAALLCLERDAFFQDCPL